MYYAVLSCVGGGASCHRQLQLTFIGLSSTQLDAMWTVIDTTFYNNWTNDKILDHEK
jgi:hypothetical protein